MAMTGGCLCGAVRFEAEPGEMTSHACHCGMCRRWSGSALVAVQVAPDAITFEGAEHVRTIQSSAWAERAWCDRCGSNLFYRITMAGPMQGQRHVAMGLFDDPDALPLTSEIYIDRKPSSFAYAGSHHTMTEAEVEAMFGSPPGAA